MNFREETRLPFLERPDLSPFLVHLTKAKDGQSAFENLISILKSGRIRGSSSKEGFIKGNHRATCFMDVPLGSLKYVLNKANTDPKSPRYGPYGIVVSKAFAYRHDARPVLYLSQQEQRDLEIPSDELWRVVRFDGVGNSAKGWSHEREWRAKRYFNLPSDPLAVLVRTSSEARKLQKTIADSPKQFLAKPRSILPLNIVCQGLPYLSA